MVALRPFGPLSFADDAADSDVAPFPQGSHNFFTANGNINPAGLGRALDAAAENCPQVEETDQSGAPWTGTTAATEGLPSVPTIRRSTGAFA